MHNINFPNFTTMEVNFTNRFPVITSEKVTLRQLNGADAEFIHYIRNDAHVNRFLDRTPTESLADAAFFIDQRNQDFFYKKAIYWGIEVNTNGFLVGTITLWNIDLENGTSELGFEIHPSFENRGLMSEAIRKVLEYGRRMLKLKSITAVTSPQNIAAIHLLEKFGFEILSQDDISEIDQEAGLVGYRFVMKSI